MTAMVVFGLHKTNIQYLQKYIEMFYIFVKVFFKTFGNNNDNGTKRNFNKG